VPSSEAPNVDVTRFWWVPATRITECLFQQTIPALEGTDRWKPVTISGRIFTVTAEITRLSSLILFRHCSLCCGYTRLQPHPCPCSASLRAQDATSNTPSPVALAVSSPRYITHVRAAWRPQGHSPKQLLSTALLAS
jgi:hypothetical protein